MTSSFQWQHGSGYSSGTSLPNAPSADHSQGTSNAKYMFTSAANINGATARY